MCGRVIHWILSFVVYPMIINRFHGSRTFRLPGMLLTFALIMILFAPSVGATLVTSWPSNIRVSDFGFNPSTTDQVEPTIAANPTNVNNLIAAYMDRSAGHPCIAYNSLDLGTSWGSRNSILTSCNDPVARFRSDGTAYLVVLVDTDANSYIYLMTSDNGGAAGQGRRLLPQAWRLVSPDRMWISRG